MTNQDLILACIERVAFNDFDGVTISQALRLNAGLWRAIVFSDERGSAYLLRDLPQTLHITALYVESSGKDDDTLVDLLRGLRADEVAWTDDFLGVTEGRVLRAWWD